MTGIKSVFLVLMNFLFFPPTRGDVEVTCVFMESCILPCRFQAGDEVVIHWIQLTAEDAQVYTYYHNQDQVSLQNKRFKGRTSLFKDQISRGNASLQLTGVGCQDQGRYKCYTSTICGNKETFINLKVDAPVLKVDIQQRQNIIICRSDGIYPKPELTWSTSPPSNVTLRNIIEVQQTEQQQLYNIISWLILSDSSSDLTYICTISTQRSSRTASLKIPNSSTQVAVIAGVVVGAIFFVIVGLGVYYKRIMSKKGRQMNQTDSKIPEPPTSFSDLPREHPLNVGG